MSTILVDHEVCTKLSNLVGELTNSGGKQLDPKIMKQIKSICKANDNYLEQIYHVIMTQMQRDHSEVRYTALLITDELFKRSHKFRNLLLSDFQIFLELTVETDPEYPLPPPRPTAKDLKIKALELVQSWYNQFKDGYKLLVLGFNFLKDCKKVDFANIAARSVAEQRQTEDVQRRKDNVLQEKANKITEEMNELFPEIESVLTQMEFCFRILLPHTELFFLPGDFDPEPEQVSTYSESFLQDLVNEKPSTSHDLRQHGISNRHSYNVQIDNFKDKKVTIEQNEDTDPLLETLKDLHAQVTQTFIPHVMKWLDVFTKCGISEELKKVINLKQKLMNAAEKFQDLKIEPKTVEVEKNYSSDEDDFEDVEEKEGFEPVIPQHLRKEYGLPIDSPTKTVTSTKPLNWKIISETKDDIKDPTTRSANINALCQKMMNTIKEETIMSTKSHQIEPEESNKSELFSKAPKLHYDVDLYHWEEEKLEAPNVVKFDSLHSFWHRESDSSKTNDEEAVAALRCRRIDFSGKFEPVKWTCRAPLPNGKLCPRQDRVKCPFHGLVVPRDVLGNPSDKETNLPSTSKTLKQEQVPDWQEPGLLRDLEAATGINLKMPEKRGKGKGKSTKKKNTKLTDIKTIQNTARMRLGKKVLSKGALRRVSEKMDASDRKRHCDKFANQWNYSFNT